MPRVVGQLLEEINGFAEQKTMLLLIGNTNVPWLIDDAFLNPRRFGRQIYIPLPDATAREQIMQLHLHQVPCEEALPLSDFVLQLEGYSGADIAQICYRARSIPFLEVVHGREVRPLTERDIQQAMAQVEPTVSPAVIRRFESYAQSRATTRFIV
jgi:transitional endoplasmic reticulum ATPase